MLKSRRSFHSVVLAAVALAAGSSLFAGEKIQLSRPQQPSETARPPEVRKSLAPASPNSFSGNVNTAPGTAMPAPRMIIPSQRDREAADEKRNWIFAVPQDKSQSVEEALGVKDYSPEHKERSVVARYLQHQQDASSAAEAAVREAFIAENEPRAPRTDFLFENRLNMPSAAPQTGLSRDTLFDSRPSLAPVTPGSLADFWRTETTLTPELSGSERTVTRRNEFQQLFEIRAGLDPVNALNSDSTREPANPIFGSTDPLMRSSSQSTFSDPFRATAQNPLMGGNSAAFENPNARVLAPSAPTSLSPIAEPTRPKQQPAVLPFPARPGDLFRMSGGL